VQKYPVRASHRTNLEGPALARLLEECFGSATVDGDAAATSFGAIVRLSARAAKRELAIDVSMNPKVDDAVARDTIARYNRFLEAATGFSSKERARRLRKAAGEAPKGA
jgi:hypothetical protein